MSWLFLLVFLQVCHGLHRLLQDESSPSLLMNRNPPFRNVSSLNPDKQGSALVLFIAITSGPHHSHLRHAIRSTWTIPCRLASDCDYRFFVDAAPSRMSAELQLEALTHNDMVFRGSCPLMDRHPVIVNYGNSPPVGGNMQRTDDNASSPTFQQSVPLADYAARRIYKIDWKVCFLQWSVRQYASVGSYVMVEDDSFVCTENLLFQFRILQNITQSANTSLSYRMGMPMYDGFDDSSTIMDGAMGRAFAQHYPSDLLNCATIENSTDPGFLSGTVFLSWGNSWRKVHCDWVGQLSGKLGLQHIRQTYVACTTAKMGRHGSVEFPCMDMPLILHHSRAVEVVLKRQSEARVRHVCEYMWLIDKVKEPENLFEFWNTASVAHHFHNFSMLFTAENDEIAWKELLGALDKEEVALRQTSANCQAINSTKRFPCFFEANDTEIRRRHLQAAVSYRDYFVPPLA